MKKFEEPVVLVETLAVQDIITNSNCDTHCDGYCGSDCGIVSEEGGGI